MKLPPFRSWTVKVLRLFTHLVPAPRSPKRGQDTAPAAQFMARSDTSLSWGLGKVPYRRGTLG